ncbi:MAG: flagellin [Planctomycetes bacterium]|nr:flagellin [Planctomycetota bacterium]
MISVHNNFNLANLSRTMRSTGRDQASVMEKLSSGLRINKAADDPAGLIQSERLRAQIEGIERAIQNSVEADNLLGVVEGAFSEVNTVLRDLKNLAIDSANTGVISKEMIAANQAEMDAGIQAIDRIFNSTSYAGEKILENLDLKSILPGAALSDDQMVALDGMVQTLPYFIDEKRLAKEGPFIGAADGLLVNGDKTFLIPGMGENGDETIEIAFKDGASLDDVLAEIRRTVNGDDKTTEKSASDPATGTAADETAPSPESDADSGAATDDDNGSRDFSLTDPLLDLFTTDQSDTLASFGRRRLAEDPNKVYLTSSFLDELENLSDDDAKAAIADHINAFVPIVSIDDSDMSDDDKALYQAALDLKNLNIGTLGSIEGTPYTNANGEIVTDTYTLKDVLSGGKASLYEDPVLAMRIVEKSAKEILTMRGTVGAIRTAHSYERNVLSATHENLTRSESSLRDTDMAMSMAEFTRTQVMSQAGSRMFAAVKEQSRNMLDFLA